MNNFLLTSVEGNEIVFAACIQALATLLIGILAWTVACSQNNLAEKVERKELFKQRYENIYIVALELFSTCINLAQEYDIVKKIKNKKEKEKSINILKEKYSSIDECFHKSLNSNMFLIRKKDYDELLCYCDDFLSYVKDYLYGKNDKDFCPNYNLVNSYNESHEKIPKILSKYLYYENENILAFGFYKIYMYLKSHFSLFIDDYFPTFRNIILNIIFIICILLGLLYAIFEFLKELLKGDFLFKNSKLNFKLKKKSKYLKRNRPWPL